jgi:hypothetical protein
LRVHVSFAICIQHVHELVFMALACYLYFLTCLLHSLKPLHQTTVSFKPGYAISIVVCETRCVDDHQAGT